MRTKQLYRDPAEEVFSVRFQANSDTVEWMNQNEKITLYLVHTKASELVDLEMNSTTVFISKVVSAELFITQYEARVFQVQ